VIYCVSRILQGWFAAPPCSRRESTLKDEKGDTCAGKTWLVSALVPFISNYLLLVDQ
jgi:hypothetical protein